MSQNIAELQPFSSPSLLSVTATVPAGSSGSLRSLERAILDALGYQLSLCVFTATYWLAGSWLLLKVYGKRQQAVFLEFLSFSLAKIHIFYLPFLLALFKFCHISLTLRFFLVLVGFFLIIITTNLVSRTLILKVKLEMAANPLVNNTTIKLTFVMPTQSIVSSLNVSKMGKCPWCNFIQTSKPPE